MAAATAAITDMGNRSPSRRLEHDGRTDGRTVHWDGNDRRSPRRPVGIKSLSLSLGGYGARGRHGPPLGLNNDQASRPQDWMLAGGGRGGGDDVHMDAAVAAVHTDDEFD